MSLRAAAAAAALGVSGGAGTAAMLAPGAPELVTGIPNRALVAYVAAANSAPCPMRWSDLAAVGVVESGHGSHGGAHIRDDGTISQPIGSPAGAQGPMQFMPETWDAYVAAGYGDGDGDGATDIDDIDDAANASAAYLCRNGYVAGDAAAVTNAWGAYNGGAGWRAYSESQAYVLSAASYAAAYEGRDVTGVPAVYPAAAPARDRSFGRLAGNVWRLVVDGWVKVGGSSDPKVRDAWQSVDDELFGEPSR